MDRFGAVFAFQAAGVRGPRLRANLRGADWRDERDPETDGDPLAVGGGPRPAQSRGTIADGRNQMSDPKDKPEKQESLPFPPTPS